MSETTRTIKIVEFTLNTLELCGILLVLFMALAFQLIFHELPCPLCLLQRIGFLMIGLGFMMNLRFGLRPSHYAVVILSALFTAFVALRQISLHVVPGTGSYGIAILGLHMYTWSFIVSVATIVVTTILMSIDRQYLHAKRRFRFQRSITHALLIILLLFAIFNAVSTFAECGFAQCPENPTTYFG